MLVLYDVFQRIHHLPENPSWYAGLKVITNNTNTGGMLIITVAVPMTLIIIIGLE